MCNYLKGTIVLFALFLISLGLVSADVGDPGMGGPDDRDGICYKPNYEYVCTETASGYTSCGCQCKYDTSQTGSCEPCTKIRIYRDFDGDGRGNAYQSMLYCEENLAPGGSYVTNSDDCNDEKINVWQLLTGYTDGDGDGYGFGDRQTFCSVNLPSGYVNNKDDLDDGDVSINLFPDVDGDGYASDEDCDDDNVDIWQELDGYVDGDNDGYGFGAQQNVCSGNSLSEGYSSNSDDCNDGEASVNPGATEVCGDGIDNDCSGGDEVCVVDNEHDVKVTVIESVTRNPLEGIPVYFNNIDDLMIFWAERTDVNGETFFELEEGDYELAIVSYDHKLHNQDITIDQDLDLTFELIPKEYFDVTFIFEEEITGERIEGVSASATELPPFEAPVTGVSDANGEITLNLREGFYEFDAEKSGYVSIDGWSLIVSESESLTIEMTREVVDLVPTITFFSASETSGDVPLEVDFDCQAIGGDGGLTYSWFFGEDVTSGLQNPSYTYENPGTYTATCTAKDEDGDTDSMSVDIEVLEVPVATALEIVELNCFSDVTENHNQACSVFVENDLELAEGGADVKIYYSDNSEFGSCVTDSITGGCSVSDMQAGVGTKEVYAIATKQGLDGDVDEEPRFVYTVLEEVYDIVNLKVFSDDLFSAEDYDFYRGENLFVSFGVTKDDVLVESMITKATLISPQAGGQVDLVEISNSGGTYYYELKPVPATHYFIGDSQVFTFAFDFVDESGGQEEVSLTIRNSAPVIIGEIPDQEVEDGKTKYFDLSGYEADKEDSGEDLRWEVVNGSFENIRVSLVGKILEIKGLDDGEEKITLRLYDLDGDYDEQEIEVKIKKKSSKRTGSRGIDVRGFETLGQVGDFELLDNNQVNIGFDEPIDIIGEPDRVTSFNFSLLVLIVSAIIILILILVVLLRRL